MVFVYNHKKSAENKRKHGIDFEEAQALRNNDSIELPSKNPSEERRLVIGMLNGTCWTAIVTYRDNNIRLISVRRARKDEKTAYEKIHYSR